MSEPSAKPKTEYLVCMHLAAENIPEGWIATSLSLQFIDPRFRSPDLQAFLCPMCTGMAVGSILDSRNPHLVEVKPESAAMLRLKGLDLV